jgi:saccharopine dehydrogenase (NADP+, L-glutamate forming)
MLEKLRYQPGERDMLVMVHHFLASFPDGHREKITSTLVDFGTPAFSSMARTVSLPAALATDLILRGRIAARGVVRPVTPEFYTPILAGLADLDIICKEESRTL